MFINAPVIDIMSQALLDESGKRNKTKQINKFGVEIKIRYFIEYSIEHLFTMIFGGKDLFTKIDTTYLLSKVCRQYFTQCHPTQSNDYS